VTRRIVTKLQIVDAINIRRECVLYNINFTRTEIDLAEQRYIWYFDCEESAVHFTLRYSEYIVDQ